MTASKQFPAQNGAYIVRVKGNQSTDSWQNYDTVRLQISVGQDYHEGGKLSATAEWSKHRFKKVFFCVNDTLQRFNIMFERSLDEAAAEKKSSILGKEWVARNMPVIKGVPQAQIVTWNEWKAKPAYPKGFLQTEWLYVNNEEFRRAIDRNIEEIWKRRENTDPAFYKKGGYDNFFVLSKRYLLEEMAAFALMYDTEEAIDIYPGTTLFAATLFRGRNIEGAPQGLGKGHFCRIDFDRR